MTLKFEVSGRIARPVEEVFEAVADPTRLSGYFTTGGASARLEEGTTVMWDFHDFPGAFPVRVSEVVKNRKIVLHWQADGSQSEPGGAYDTVVTMRFEPLGDGRTLVSIAEEGFRETDSGRKASYGNCMGWAQMISAMKAWVEHGINLREGMYR